VAFAFSRAFGPAVTRNRMRRRVRAVLHDLDRCSTLPPGLLLVGGRPQLIELTFDQLTTELTEMVERIRRTPPSNV